MEWSKANSLFGVSLSKKPFAFITSQLRKIPRILPNLWDPFWTNSGSSSGRAFDTLNVTQQNDKLYEVRHFLKKYDCIEIFRLCSSSRPRSLAGRPTWPWRASSSRWRPRSQSWPRPWSYGSSMSRIKPGREILLFYSIVGNEKALLSTWKYETNTPCMR